MGTSRRQRAYRVLIRDLRFGWIFLGWCAICLLVTLSLCSDNSARLHWMGFSLQSSGLLAVAYGLARRTTEFGTIKVWHSIRQWFIRLWWIARPPKPKTINVSAGAKLELKAGSASITVWNEDADVEQKIAMLREQLTNLQTRMNEGLSQLKQDVRRLDDAFALGGKEQSRINANIDIQVKNLATGGIGLEYVGVMWLFLGLLLSALSAVV